MVEGNQGLDITPLRFKQHLNLQFLLNQLNLSTSVSLSVKWESCLPHSFKELKTKINVKVPITDALLY